MKRFAGTAVLCFVLCVLQQAKTEGLADDAKPTFTTFEAPGAGTAEYQGTIAFSINTAGTIAGYSVDSGGVHHGFVRATGGAITTIDAPGAGTASNEGTVAFSINTAGAITGHCVDSSKVYHGYRARRRW
jgi:hypothetical protein